MALSKEVYKAFEDVVGVDNICNDPLIMPAYHSADLAAVVLPKNTEEVQAVIKLCNKYKVGFTGTSSGWILGAPPSDIIYLDMRRMNRIIEINEKNMYAVVEPYVISAELQAELMKRGLNCNIKGAGSNTSAILKGHGHFDQIASGDDRNYLAMEWVTPEGEIIRLGSLGSSDEWFCGDGPGPSLRAMIHGTIPPGVTQGIFTKAAQKVYPWPGPTKFPIEGVSPHYTLSEIPPNMLVRYFSFPSLEKEQEAERKLGESEVSYEVMCFNILMVCQNMTASAEEEMEIYELLRHEVQGPGFLVIITGNSPAEFEYNQRVMERIVRENDGESLKVVEEDPRIAGILLCHDIRICASIKETSRFRDGVVAGGIAIMGQRDLQARWIAECAKTKVALIERGLAVDDGGVWHGWGVEHGHLGKSEIFCLCTSKDPKSESEKAVAEWQRETAMMALEGCFGVPWRGLPIDIIEPRICNFFSWWEKFRKAFDPNGVAAEVILKEASS